MSSHHHKDFSEKKIERRKILRAVAIILAVAAVIAIGLCVIKNWEDSRSSNVTLPTAQIVDDNITVDGVEYAKKKNIETLLVLGLDKYDGEIAADSYSNDRQSDFLMLFVFDHTEGTYSALHINRDTMAEIDVLGIDNQKVSSVTKQLALAHTYGDGKNVSCKNAVRSVSRILNNIEIEHYLSVTMDAVPVINDRVGGVEVTVLDDFSGIDDTLIKDETVTLYGDHALTYVRTRYGMDDSTNSTRMVRQRQYLESLFATAKTAAQQDEDFIIETTIEMSDYLVSDYTIEQLQDLLTCLSEYDFVEIKTIDGDNIIGEDYIEFYPNEDSVEEVILELLYSPVE